MLNHTEYMRGYRKTETFKTYWKNLKTKNRKHFNELELKRKRKVRPQNKKIVFEHYGNKCECCGESEPLFLTIDHINNDGYADKKKGLTGPHLYAKIIKENFPSTFRLLCWNCNCGRRLNGGVCPHKRKTNGNDSSTKTK
jgi:hypothetical protein